MRLLPLIIVFQEIDKLKMNKFPNSVSLPIRVKNKNTPILILKMISNNNIKPLTNNSPGPVSQVNS